MKFSKSMVLTFATNILLFGIGMIISVITSRFLGPQGKGITGLSTNLVAFFLIILDLGIGASNTYFIGKNNDRVNEVMSCNLLITFFECIFVVVIFFINLKFPIFLFKGLTGACLVLTMIVIPTSSLKAALINIILGLQQYKNYNKINVFSQVVNLALISVLVVNYRSAYFVILSTLITNCITILFILNLIIRKNKLKLKPEFSLFKPMVKYGIKIQLSNFTQLLTYRLDVFIINYFLLVSDVGIYSNAVALAEMMWQIPGTVSTLIYSRVSNSDDKEDIKDITNKCMRISFGIIIICTLILALISRPLILILYGAKFERSINALLLLLPGICLFSVSKVLASCIAGLGRVDINLKISVLVCFITVICDISLIPIFNINGASIATSLTYIAHAALTLGAYRKLTSSSLKEIMIINKDDIDDVKGFILNNIKLKYLANKNS